MAAATVDIGSLIEARPGYRGGRPCLAGTGTTVHAIAALYLEGLSPEQILDEFPDLDLPRIFAALAYYHANKAAMEADWEADEERGRALMAEHPSGWTRETT